MLIDHYYNNFIITVIIIITIQTSPSVWEIVFEVKKDGKRSIHFI